MPEYIEIDPLDKEKDILEALKEYDPKSYAITDEGYDWMEEETSKCVVIKNPYETSDLEINIGDRNEFTVFFAGFHEHFFAYECEYERMLATVKRILRNELCAALLCDAQGKWFGSSLPDQEEKEQGPEKVFDTVFKIDEFREKLTKRGYTVEYRYWDPADDATVTVGPQ